MKFDIIMVFSFFMKLLEGVVICNDMVVLEQLEFWLIYQCYWCEYKLFVIVFVCDYEWLDVGVWVYKYFDEVSGISFLFYLDYIYQQVLYQECMKEEYEVMFVIMFDVIDWVGFVKYELEDMIKGSQIMVCIGGVCEIVDLI